MSEHSDRFLEGKRLTLEELRGWGERAKQLPEREPAYRDRGMIEVFTGRFDPGEPERALFIDPLRIYVRARLVQVLVPVLRRLVENLLQRDGTIDPAVVNSKFSSRIEPVIIAEHFYGEHKHEIVDGNHTYIAFAVAFEKQRHLLPLEVEPSAPGFVVPPDVWKDFLAVYDDQDRLVPQNPSAMKRRLHGIDHDFPLAALKASVKQAKRRWKGRP